MLKRFIKWCSGIITPLKNSSRSAWSSNDWLTLIFVIFCVIVICAFVIATFAFVLLWPLALAWAINYLFGTTLPLNFQTWAAIFLIAWVVNFVRGKPIIKVTTKH